MKGLNCVLNPKEVKAIIEVLENGMPDGPKKRAFLAKIWNKLCLASQLSTN